MGSKKLPPSVEEAVNQLLPLISDELKECLKNSHEPDLSDFHFTLGLWIRNNFGLVSGENPELLYSCAEHSNTGRIYPDIGLAFIEPGEAAIVIIRALWERLKDSSINRVQWSG